MKQINECLKRLTFHEQIAFETLRRILEKEFHLYMYNIIRISYDKEKQMFELIYKLCTISNFKKYYIDMNDIKEMEKDIFHKNN